MFIKYTENLGRMWFAWSIINKNKSRLSFVHEHCLIYLAKLKKKAFPYHYISCHWPTRYHDKTWNNHVGPLWKTCRCHGLTPSNVKLTRLR